MYYWLPKMTGHMLSERLGKISFWTMFVGFNLAFFPMHILGFLGMPRRVWTYSSGLGWDGLNSIVSIGAAVFAFGTVLSLFNWVWSVVRKVPAPPNPWGADSLEWATTSPPPEYNFASIPVVAGRHPLWQQDPLPTAASGDDPATRALGIEGALRRENPITGGLEGRPEQTAEIPRETYLPLLLALGLAVFFAGLLIDAVVIGVIGVALAFVGLVWWAWRTEMDLV